MSGGRWNEVTMEEWLIHWFSFFSVKKMKHHSLHCKISFSSHFWICVISMKQLSLFLFRLHITSWPRHSTTVSGFHLFWMLTWESLALNTDQRIKLKLNILFHSVIFLWKGSRHYFFCALNLHEVYTMYSARKSEPTHSYRLCPYKRTTILRHSHFSTAHSTMIVQSRTTF